MRFIPTAGSRDGALSQTEIGPLLRAIYQSSIRPPYTLALRLPILCVFRKGELIGARWEQIDFEKTQGLIPAERTKKDTPHLVPLSKQAVAMSRCRSVLGDVESLAFSSAVSYSTLWQARSSPVTVLRKMSRSFLR